MSVLNPSGFFKVDSFRKKKRITFVHRNSLGDKVHEPCHVVELVTDGGARFELMITKEALQVRRTDGFGVVAVIPTASNVVEVRALPYGDW